MSDLRSHENVETRLVGAVLHITLANEKRANALSRDAAIFLADLLDEVSLDRTDIRGVLIKGAGRHFCAGADLSGPLIGEKPVNGHMVRSLTGGHHRAVQSAFDCRIPTVAAVSGRAMGFGLHLAAACDLVVAAEDAIFEEPFTDRGFNVDSGGSWLLPRLIGPQRAKWMLYTAAAIEAATAVQWGLALEVVPSNEFSARAEELVSLLASRPTQAIGATKRLVDSTGTDLAGAMHAEAMAVELVLRSKDFAEGMSAFRDRRDPNFTGQ
ncbi:MAG: enoyl-CoA hydratase-related protein [bacterium]|nr:enoyl-CoA hydratase-related protein [bacterium]MCY3889870.1 enoyl-CoA hydratase-related protein [bacterium]MCY3960217.1 enoyl-CoA hydratase-related protein [bacterium]